VAIVFTENLPFIIMLTIYFLDTTYQILNNFHSSFAASKNNLDLLVLAIAGTRKINKYEWVDPNKPNKVMTIAASAIVDPKHSSVKK